MREHDEALRAHGDANVIAKACSLLDQTGPSGAAEWIARAYPFVPVSPTKRSYSEGQLTELFIRDGFIDRYSGQKLVFPGVLRLLADLLPEGIFPFQPNWKSDSTHPAFWQLFPTLDHIVPVSRGGPPDPDPSNWVTTSQLRNSAKANWTLEELNWSLVPPGKIADWDGLLRWFLDYSREHPAVLKTTYLRRWHGAASRSVLAP